MLVDGRGVPLSLVVTGAKVHDCKGLDAVLGAAASARKSPPRRRRKYLCADAGYRARGTCVPQSHGCTPHVVDHRKEAGAERLNLKKKARRWVAEVAHSWFNWFRKLLVRYENLDRSFLALNHLAASIMALRKIKLTVNIIYR